MCGVFKVKLKQHSPELSMDFDKATPEPLFLKFWGFFYCSKVDMFVCFQSLSCCRTQVLLSFGL